MEMGRVETEKETAMKEIEKKRDEELEYWQV